MSQRQAFQSRYVVVAPFLKNAGSRGDLVVGGSAMAIIVLTKESQSQSVGTSNERGSRRIVAVEGKEAFDPAPIFWDASQPERLHSVSDEALACPVENLKEGM